MKRKIANILAITAGIFALTVHSTGFTAAGPYGGGIGNTSWHYEDVNDAAYSSYRKAQKLIKKEKFNKALEKLLKAEQKDNDSADIQNLLGFTYRKLEQFDTALIHYTNALRIDPEHIGATEYLGQLYVDTGQFNKAQKQLAKLKLICGMQCNEYQSLAKAIASKDDRYKKAAVLH